LSEKVFVTNETGKKIINLLEGGYSEEEILDFFSKRYEIEKEIVKKDIEGFILQLANNSLIVRN